MQSGERGAGGKIAMQSQIQSAISEAQQLATANRRFQIDPDTFPAAALRIPLIFWGMAA
jgi:hypothetical protein